MVDNGKWTYHSAYFYKTQQQEIGYFSLQAVWNDTLSYSENLGYVGGFGELQIFKNKKPLQTIYKIEDGIALGEIRFSFYDYNMDGHLDFSVPIDCGKSCYDSYYLFNPETGRFQHYEEWDYLRIQELHRTTKQIRTVPEGTAVSGESKLFQIEGNQLVLLEVTPY